MNIEILDENDNCPQLHIDSSLLLINRDTNSRIQLFHLYATDQDEHSNGKITFELSPSTSPSFVELFPNGTLRIRTDSESIQDNIITILHIQIRDHGQPTPCLIVETLRLFFGTNRTDWGLVKKNHQHYDSALVG